MKTVQDNARGEETARALLLGAGFSRFCFSTQFSLWFDRPALAAYAGPPAPAEVELVLHGSWRFGGEEDWNAEVARFSPPGAVEPDEPVQARNLAHLRWTEGATIKAVAFAGTDLRLEFENGQVLTVLAGEQGETTWALGTLEGPETETSWSVTAVGDELFVRTPGGR